MNRFLSCRRGVLVATLLCLYSLSLPVGAQTIVNLADQPFFSATVPANVALVLSVEYPTAISVANPVDYADTSTYVGYFDPMKCYTYAYNSATPSSSYFVPAAFGTGLSGHQCSGMWSGNFMNWATMQTIDPFRWALTGGYRSEDDSITVLEKAWGSLQGGTSNSLFPFNSVEFPYRGTSQLTGNYLSPLLISLVTPFSNWGAFNSAIWGNGNTMIFSGGTALTPATGYYSAYGYGTTFSMAGTANPSVYDLPSDVSAVNILAQPATFRVYVRVQVCNTGTASLNGVSTSLLEKNCVKYGSYYKPEGLVQKYSGQVRIAALSYLNGDGITQQGGVLRAPMGYVGPTYTSPLSTSPVTNPLAEWSSTDGHQFTNPDTASASASGVSQSGVIQYLNQFGEYTAKVTNAGNYTNNTNTYMKDDNVSELYYAAIRYFENLGNVSVWSTPQSTTSAIELDGFPAVTTWTDPIAYSCAKNSIIGIGDDHTHYDYNVANNNGATDTYITRPDPSFSDTINQAYTWTSDVESLEGISSSPPWYNYSGGGGSYATYFIAGLAYGAHVSDIRPDLTGKQTISTYWLDVEEYGLPEYQNQYYMATKYGGFSVPSNYSISNTTPLTPSWYESTTVPMTTHFSGSYTTGVLKTSPQPTNYFLAGNGAAMASGLTSAFSSVASGSAQNGTAYTLSSPDQTSAGGLSFSSQYEPINWTDVITASTLSYNTYNVPQLTTVWASSATLQAQLAGTGWQTARKVVTWSGTAGVPFEVANLSTTQLAALTPSSYASNSNIQYLNYLRGDQSNEIGSTTGGTQSLRARTLLLGDVVDASLTPVAGPSMSFSEGYNPGYAAFTTLWSARPTMVYAGANDGMLHGFLGALGSEVFAYVPNATFQGPTSTPQVNGLAALGNPNFIHHYYVDATPLAFDIDLNRTGTNASGAGTPDWHTLLIGGLGKGGMSFYAIDVTDPATMAVSSESVIASKVKWEFTDPTMGYSYGAPIVVKTVKWGWVVILTSGYNSSSTTGYIYLVNPNTGALLQKIATSGASSGLTQAAAFVQDYTDFTADSVYVGDLNGQLWRFNLTDPNGNYPSATLLATLTDSSGNAQPITTAPEIEIHPTTRERYVMVGTGQFLSGSDSTTTLGQSFYVILDGASGTFNTVTTPITRTSLQAVTASGLVAGITLSPTKLGWYIDLGTGTGGVAWRVILNPSAYDGTVTFAAFLPTGTVCSSSSNATPGQGEVYAVNYATATSILISQPAGYATFTSSVVNLNYVGVNGSTEIVAGLASGSVYKVPVSLSTVVSTRILNWRELPSAQ